MRELLRDLRGNLYLQLDSEIDSILKPTTMEEKREDRGDRLARIDPQIRERSDIPRFEKLIQRIDNMLSEDEDGRRVIQCGHALYEMFSDEDAPTWDRMSLDDRSAWLTNGRELLEEMGFVAVE